MIRVVPLVHVGADDQIPRLGFPDDLVRFMYIEAHWLLDDHMDAAPQGREYRRSVKMIGCGNEDDVEVGIVAQDVLPRRLAPVAAHGSAGSRGHLTFGPPRRRLAPRTDGHQLEPHVLVGAAEVVQPDAVEVGRDAVAM